MHWADISSHWHCSMALKDQHHSQKTKTNFFQIWKAGSSMGPSKIVDSGKELAEGAWVCLPASFCFLDLKRRKGKWGARVVLAYHSSLFHTSSFTQAPSSFSSLGSRRGRGSDVMKGVGVAIAPGKKTLRGGQQTELLTSGQNCENLLYVSAPALSAEAKRSQVHLPAPSDRAEKKSLLEAAANLGWQYWVLWTNGLAQYPAVSSVPKHGRRLNKQLLESVWDRHWSPELCNSLVEWSMQSISSWRQKTPGYNICQISILTKTLIKLTVLPGTQATKPRATNECRWLFCYWNGWAGFAFPENKDNSVSPQHWHSGASCLCFWTEKSCKCKPWHG